MGIKTYRYLIFYAVTKRTTHRQQPKNQLKLARKRCRRLKDASVPSKYVGLRLLRTPIM